MLDLLIFKSLNLELFDLMASPVMLSHLEYVKLWASQNSGLATSWAFSSLKNTFYLGENFYK